MYKPVEKKSDVFFMLVPFLEQMLEQHRLQLERSCLPLSYPQNPRRVVCPVPFVPDLLI